MRENILKQLSIDNNIIIYDPTSIKWQDFTWDNGFFEHEITYIEVIRPYLIAHAYYNNSEYEDIIFLINNIADLFELRAGIKIRIPKVEDIQSFILKNKLQQG